MRPLGFLIAIVTIVAAGIAATSWSRRQRALDRLSLDGGPSGPIADGGADTALAPWLARAGYRKPTAPSIFTAATLACGLAGVLIAQLYRLTLQTTLVAQVEAIPGGAGEIFGEILRRGGWILFILISLVPAMAVRARRRARMRAI